MPKKKPHFNARDIDNLIPELDTIFDHIDTCRRRAEAFAAAFPSATPPSAQDIAEAQRLRSQVDFLMQAIQDNIEYSQSLGGVTKDVESGLVDFPGQMNGEDVWLCWKRGETKVRYWHGLEEGFSQRQTLRRPESPTTTFH
jgi:hypothetical protein